MPFMALQAENDTILIDFGSTLTAAPWNNMNSVSGEGAIANLMNSKSLKTAMGVSVYDRFNGINTGGTTTPDASIGFPATTASDSYFGNVAVFSGTAQPTGAMLFTGLNASKSYSFVIFASRTATDNREAKYKFTGIAKDSVYLNSSNNTANVATITVQPAADGTIDLTVSPGPNNNNASGFFYLGAIKMIYEHEDALPPAIEITSPNGGETLFTGNLFNVTWSNTNLIENIELSYSPDNGTTWKPIDVVPPTQESYSWTIPEDITYECLIKATSGTASDVSDAVFTMVPGSDMIMIDFGDVTTATPLPWNNLTSTSGEGSIQKLRNSRNLLTGMGVSVYDRFNGINTGGTTTPDGTIGFPETATRDSYYGNVAEFSGSQQPTGAMLFTGLNPAKTYTFDIFASRTSVTDNREAKYRFIGATKDSVYLDASNNTANKVTLAMVPAVDGTIDLTVSPGPNNTNSSGFYYLGAMKMSYDFEDALPPAIEVTAPNGGEVLFNGNLYTLTWANTNLIADVELSYSTDNGVSWNPIATVDKTVESYIWTVPDDISEECLFQVSSGTVSDVSDAVFTMMSGSDMIMIDFGDASTASAEPWNNISGTNGAGEIAMLKNSRNLYTAMGVNVNDRFTGINTNGTTAPDASVGIPVTAAQDNFFGNVGDHSGIKEPTGGMVFTGMNPAKSYTFKMFASRMGVTDNRETKYKFIGAVTDSVYLDAANNTANIVEFTLQPAADGTINLIVSPGENNTNSTKYFYLGSLRISYDFEDALPPTLTLESPNGDEVWVGGTSHTISWSSINIKSDIDVSYSSDNGVSWNPIATVSKASTSVVWDVPVLQSSECLVKLASGSTEDVSDHLFTIQDPANAYVSIISPNGGETWLTGSSHMIKWNSIALVDDIAIEFSSDNGSNWSSVATVGADEYSYLWTVPSVVSSECLVKLTSGAFSDVSLETFSTIEPLCNNTIVVLGSSTAYGSGASPIDSSWVNRYKRALKEITSDYNVVNLALGGYTTFQILPTGTSMPDGVSESIDTERNITKAMTYNPYAIIINMPSNDATKNYGVDLQLANYETIVELANASGIQVWIATTQPRNFTNPAQVQIQVDMKDTLMAIYGDNCIDFWTGVATETGWINTTYDSGDGVHLNNAGHRLLFQRVLAKGIESLACVEPDGIDRSSATMEGVRVFPNPYSDYSSVEFETVSEGTAILRFYDVTGREVGMISEPVSFGGSHMITVTGEQIGTENSLVMGVLLIEDSLGTRQYSFKLLHNK